MKKRILALMCVFALIITLIPNSLVKAEINQAAVDYLLLQTQDAWVTMALSAVGETNLDLSHLETVEGTLATDYQKAVLALVAAGEDPTTFGNIDYVQKIKTDYYSDNQIGDTSLLNDDMWGILALASAGENENSQIMQDAKNFLLNNQNQDGGWPYSVGGGSDTNDTAAAIMALLEVGLNESDTAIDDAIEYLKNQQNSDGGFPYTQGSDSDSGSDAWVISAIHKLGQDPISPDWQNNSNNAVDHLKSLQKGDGSFKWIATDDTSYTSMTAFAVIALAEKFHPITSLVINPSLHKLRIEGSSNLVCETETIGTTALDIVQNASMACNYTFEIQDTAFGPYLFSINGEDATGVSGWMYFVNNVSPPVGAADYTLQQGEEVLWYYGEWGWQPTRISVDKTYVDVGEEILILVEYHNGTDWAAFPEADIMVGVNSYTVDGNGQKTLTMNDAGSFDIYVENINYVRSNIHTVTVGSIDEEKIGLEVEIELLPQPDVSFEVTIKHFNYGQMNPGEQKEEEVSLINTGEIPIYVEGIVSGDDIFKDNIELNGKNWQDYYSTLSVSTKEEIDVRFTVPSQYDSQGVKTGDLTFWAVGAN